MNFLTYTALFGFAAAESNVGCSGQNDAEETIAYVGSYTQLTDPDNGDTEYFDSRDRCAELVMSWEDFATSDICLESYVDFGDTVCYYFKFPTADNVDDADLRTVRDDVDAAYEGWAWSEGVLLTCLDTEAECVTPTWALESEEEEEEEEEETDEDLSVRVTASLIATAAVAAMTF